GYLRSLGLARTAQVKCDARIGEAEARRDAGIREAEAEKQRVAGKLLNDIEISKSKRDFELQNAAYEKEVQSRKAESELAYELQTFVNRAPINVVKLINNVSNNKDSKFLVQNGFNLSIENHSHTSNSIQPHFAIWPLSGFNSTFTESIKAAKVKQQIKEEEMQITVLEKTQQIQVEELEIVRQERHLDATVRKPAEAERFRLERLAEADRLRLTAEAEAEAESIRLRGLAEAEALKAIAHAEAEQMAKKAEAWKNYQVCLFICLLIKIINVARLPSI
ncbi:unnamed protein product, partial [Schistosoma margrebowiei]